MTILLIALGVIYGIALFSGFLYPIMETKLSYRWYDLKIDMYNIPIKKILFTFDMGMTFCYWVIGWLFGFRTKEDKKKRIRISNMENKIKSLEKENTSIKKESITMATELELLTGENKDLVEVINE